MIPDVDHNSLYCLMRYLVSFRGILGQMTLSLPKIWGLKQNFGGGSLSLTYLIQNADLYCFYILFCWSNHDDGWWGLWKMLNQFVGSLQLGWMMKRPSLTSTFIFSRALGSNFNDRPANWYLLTQSGHNLFRHLF